MKKGYLIGQITITNPKKYQQYASETEKIIKSFGGRYLIRGAEQIIAEGTPQGNRDVVVEFDTLEKAKQFYESEEYAKIIGEIPPFLELDTLLPIAATAQVENTLQ